MNSIAGHQNVCVKSTVCGVLPSIHEIRPRARRILSKVGEVVAGVYTLASQAFEYGLVQYLNQFATMNRELRPIVTGFQTSWLSPDVLPVLRVKQ